MLLRDATPADADVDSRTVAAMRSARMLWCGNVVRSIVVEAIVCRNSCNSLSDALSKFDTFLDEFTPPRIKSVSACARSGELNVARRFGDEYLNVLNIVVLFDTLARAVDDAAAASGGAQPTSTLAAAAKLLREVFASFLRTDARRRAMLVWKLAIRLRLC